LSFGRVFAETVTLHTVPENTSKKDHFVSDRRTFDQGPGVQDMIHNSVALYISNPANLF
jgi:hypothetical protein